MNKWNYVPREAVYRMSADAARTCYSTRSSRDKATPFKRYLLEVINNESGLKWPVTKIELT